MVNMIEMFVFFKSVALVESLFSGFLIAKMQKKSINIDFKFPYLIVLSAAIVFAIYGVLFWVVAIKTGHTEVASSRWYDVIVFSIIYLAAFGFFNRAPLSAIKRWKMAFLLLVVCAIVKFIGMMAVGRWMPWLMANVLQN